MDICQKLKELKITIYDVDLIGISYPIIIRKCYNKCLDSIELKNNLLYKNLIINFINYKIIKGENIRENEINCKLSNIVGIIETQYCYMIFCTIDFFKKQLIRDNYNTLNMAIEQYNNAKTYDDAIILYENKELIKYNIN